MINYLVTQYAKWTDSWLIKSTVCRFGRLLFWWVRCKNLIKTFLSMMGITVKRFQNWVRPPLEESSILPTLNFRSLIRTLRPPTLRVPPRSKHTVGTCAWMDFQDQVTGWSQNSLPVEFSNVRPLQILECVYSLALQGSHIFEKLNSLRFSGHFKFFPEQLMRGKFDGMHFFWRSCHILSICPKFSRFCQQKFKFPWVFPESRFSRFVATLVLEKRTCEFEYKSLPETIC